MTSVAQETRTATAGLIRALVPPESRGRASLLARTRREFESAFPSYYLDIAIDGIIVWDREDYAARRLRRIRELMHLAGLTRVPTPGGFLWRWARDPAGSWSIDWTGVRGL